jgi:hypothetical protein
MKKLFLLVLLAILLSCSNPESPPPEPEPEPIPFTEIFYDSIEGGIKNWTVSVPTTWIISVASSYSLTHCWTDSTALYANNQNTSLVSQVFDFTNYKDVTLQIWQAYTFEKNFDFGYIEYSIDSGTTWTIAASFTGDSSAPLLYWQLYELAIPAIDGLSTVKIRFTVKTDASNQKDGWYIDDIKIIGRVNS